MNHLQNELTQLKHAIADMVLLAGHQLEKSKQAYLNMDQMTAQEIIHTEKRLNGMELAINRECENILALYNPVATDLRMVISMLRVNSDIERIGDYADSIADYVVDLQESISEDALKATRLAEMFDHAIEMVKTIHKAIELEDTGLARKVFLMDAELNTINKNASRVINEFVLRDPQSIRPMLFHFSTIRKLERVGDHIKNIAEEMIFFKEAEVLKHRKNKIE